VPLGAALLIGAGKGWVVFAAMFHVKQYDSGDEITFLFTQMFHVKHRRRNRNYTILQNDPMDQRIEPSFQ